MKPRCLLSTAVLVLFFGATIPATAETTLEAARTTSQLASFYGVASAGKLVNADDRAYTLQLRCGDLAWSADVQARETVALGPPVAGGCELVVKETQSRLALPGPAGELRIERGVVRETIRTLRWSILRATYGEDGPWPDGVVGQWVAGAKASTQYSDDSWSARQVTGEPNTAGCGDSATAWAPLERQTTERHWIQLWYPQRVRAVGARLHVTLAPGAVKAIQARTGSGWETVWRGPDPTASCPAILAAKFTEEVDTDRIRIIVDLSRQENWFELDAVELLGTPL